ncbi:MAG TPA: FtsW/RodA/SpoVE family cell cycle protein, partial [Ktedonobacterales bacterium]
MDRRLQRALYGRQFRWTEMWLLVLPALFILLALLDLLIVHNPAIANQLAQKSLPPLDAFTPAIGLIVALIGVHILLNLIAPDADQTLLPIVGMLASIGVVMSLRLGPDIGGGRANLGVIQLLWVVIGLFLCVLTVRLTRDLSWLRNYKYTWAAAGIALVAFTLVRAHEFSTRAPSRDVLDVGIHLGSLSLTFQPSELLKICLVIFFAGYLSENREMLAAGGTRIGPFSLPPLKHLGPLVVMFGIALLLFIGVRELGLAMLVFGLFLSMLYAASDRPSYVVFGLLIFAVGAFIAYHIFSYARVRVDIVGNAFQQSSDAGYQLVQGLIAFGHGGVFGDGLGLGHPYLTPASNTDFIAASFAEEFGFAGMLALIGLFILLVYRGMHIASRARDTFSALMAIGLTAVFALQTLVILAGN